MRRLLTVLLALSLPLLAAAQGRASFGAFLARSQAAADRYRTAMNRERSAFLRSRWQSGTPLRGAEDPFSRAGEALPPPIREDADRIPPADIPSGAADDGKLRFGFYGLTYAVDYDRAGDFRLEGIGEEEVAARWDSLAKGTGAGLARECLRIRDRAGLCDWAYLQLVDSLAATVYPGAPNERQMLAGFLLGSSGYRIRFGRSDDRLSCVYATEQVIYARPYFPKEGTYCYTLAGGDGTWFLSEPCPGRPLDLSAASAPPVGGKDSLTRHVSAAGAEFDFRIPGNLLDFYGSYPHTEMRIKADAPVGEAFRRSAYPALRAALEGKGEVESVNLLLRFVQSVMTYRTDREGWGYEKWNFPEESCYYGFGDCDDYAVLFCRLVRDLLGLDVLLVECEVDGGPHAAAAVRFTEPIQGDVIMYEGQKYYCCEPTSNVARAGRCLWDSFVVTRLDKVR